MPSFLKGLATLLFMLLFAACTQQPFSPQVLSSGTSFNRAIVAVPPATSPAFAQAEAEAYSWLKSQQDQTGTGMVDSLEDYSAPNTPIPVSYTYDQAVAAIAFVLEGDIARAKQLLGTMQGTQAADGSWVNSYWNNSTAFWGEELRKHVGPVAWMAMAVMTYENVTGDTVTYRPMALKALDWCLTFAKPNGALSGGMTTWFTTPANSWQPEVWSSTEQNLDAYAALRYFAAAAPEKAAAYNAAANNIKSFLDNVVWDGTKNRFRGGFKNDTGLIDPFVPMDVNPWGVQALGTSGVHNYGAMIDYVENANANPGTNPDNPRYVQNLPYGSGAINLYDFDWESDGLPASSASGGGALGPDIWFEGSAFMSVSHRMKGEATKADTIITEIIKKQGKDGSKLGGVPYSLNATNNNYWKMTNVNCISSTGWLILAIHHWNPFTGMAVGDTQVLQASAPGFTPAGGTYAFAQSVTLSTATVGATIRYTLDGSTPTASSSIYSSPFTVSQTTTVKAIAQASGMLDSVVSSATFTISSIQQASAPTFSPSGGTYNSVQTVSLSSSTANATIRYTLDGSTPNGASAVYVSPLTISQTTTVKAIAQSSGMTDSSVSSATYTIQIVQSDFTQNLAVSGNSLAFTFVSNVSSTFVDVHYYTSKNGAQQNVRMNQNGNTWTYAATTSPTLVSGDTVTYSFTFNKPSGALDSPIFVKSVGGTLTAPVGPSNATATAVGTSVVLTWTDRDNGQAGFRVFYNTANSKPTSANATIAAGTTTWSGTLQATTLYYFWVEAYNSVGTSPSVTTSVTTGSNSTTALTIDNFNSSQRWNQGLNSLNKAVTTNGGIYNLEGDANLYFFFNGGTTAQSFTEQFGQSLAAYSQLVLVIKGGSGGEQAGLKVVLNDGSEHSVALSSYGAITTSYGNLTVPLSAFGANLANATSLRIEGRGNAQTVRIDEIKVQ